QGGFVHQVGQIGTGKTGSTTRNDRRIHVIRNWYFAHMHFQYLLTAADIGKSNHNLTVKTARPQQRRIEHVGAVGGGDDDDAIVGFKPVHFDQQLVQCLLALIVATTEASATMTSHGIDLVDEDDAWRLLLRLVEHIANARRTDADEHLDEIGTGDREKRYLGLTGNRLGEQRLTGTGWAHHQHTARNAPAEALKLARIAQELDQFADVFLGLIATCHIGKSGLDLILAEQACLALAEGHRATAATRAALHLAHEEHEHDDDDQDREAGNQQLRPQTLLLRLDALDRYLVGNQIVHQFRIVHHRTHGLKGRAVFAQTRYHQSVDGHFSEPILPDFLDEGGIGDLLLAGLHAEVIENCQQNRRNDEPQQKIFGHVVQVRTLFLALFPCKNRETSRRTVLPNCTTEVKPAPRAGWRFYFQSGSVTLAVGVRPMVRYRYWGRLR